ncbi:MAG: ornithine aminomutase subunit alpha [Endomicrobiaceae bacterium]|nr:ornithine aminomutase subunit alpha [Endomicrobiaceae bacterium]
MNKGKIRTDDFLERRKNLVPLSDDELKQYFWELAKKTVTPLIAIAKEYTTPSIERSVLLRMGFSSLEAKAIVDKVITHNLMGKGAGHVVYRLALLEDIDIRCAGLKLLKDEGWDQVKSSFGVSL